MSDDRSIKELENELADALTLIRILQGEVEAARVRITALEAKPPWIPSID